MKEFKDLKSAVEYAMDDYPEHAKSIYVTSPLLIYFNNEEAKEEFVRQLNNRGIESEYKDGIIYIKENQTNNNLKPKAFMNTENYIMLEGKKILLTEEQIKQIKYSVTSKPKWEDFGEVKGFYVNTSGEIVNYTNTKPSNLNKNTFPSKEEAEACLALSQLLQWRDKYNEGWKPDWADNTVKHVINVINNEVTIRTEMNNYSSILCFKTCNIRDKFLEDFADLLEVAKPLL